MGIKDGPWNAMGQVLAFSFISFLGKCKMQLGLCEHVIMRGNPEHFQSVNPLINNLNFIADPMLHDSVLIRKFIIIIIIGSLSHPS